MAKSVPSNSNRLIADVDAAFVQKVLYVQERKWKPNILHHGQADDLGVRLEETKEGTYCLTQKRGARPARLNKFSFDSADATNTGSFRGRHFKYFSIGSKG